jgi:hypothetical protein
MRWFAEQWLTGARKPSQFILLRLLEPRSSAPRRDKHPSSRKPQRSGGYPGSGLSRPFAARSRLCAIAASRDRCGRDDGAVEGRSHTIHARMRDFSLCFGREMRRALGSLGHGFTIVVVGPNYHETTDSLRIVTIDLNN